MQIAHVTPPPSVCGPSDINGATLCSDSVVPGPGVRIPIPQPLISVRFKCPEFGTNSAGVRLSEWPRYQRSLGKRRIISAELIGSLV